MSTSETLQIRITVDGDGQVKASLAGVSQALGEVKPKAEASGVAIEKITDAVKELAAGFTLVEAAKFFIESIAHAQILETRLRAVAASQDEVNAALESAKEIAATSANSADSATEAYIILRQRGLAPSVEMLRSFANIGAATGKSIDEVARSVGAAATGQFRALQDMGIKIEEENGKLVASYQGTKEVIGSSSADIISYIERIGNTRYAGAAQAESETLVGSWEHLKQAVADVADSVGNSGFTDVLATIVQHLADAARETDEFIFKVDNLGEKIARFGVATSGAGLATLFGGGALSLGARIGAGETQRADFSNVTSNEEALTAALGHERESLSMATLATNDLRTSKENLAAATDGVIAQLQRQLVSLQQGEAASVRYAAQQAAAKADTKEHAAVILDLGEKIATLIQKRKDDAEALKETIALQDAYNESMQRTHQLIDDEVKRERELADAYKAVLDVIDPNGREVRQLSEDYDKMAAAQKAAREAGQLTTEQINEQNKALEGLSKRIDEAKAKAKIGDFFAQITGDKDSAKQEIEGIFGDVAATFTKLLKSGFKDAGKVLGDELGKIGDQIVNDIIRNKLVNNLAQGMQKGGTVNKDDLYAGAGTAVGVYGGSAIGGGGDYANAGADVGSVIGGIVGSYFGPIGTMVGSALGGMLGGAIGGLFDKDGVAKVYSGVDSGSSTGGIDAFGRVQAYTNGLGDGAEQQLLQALMSLDNTMAKLLTPEEREKVKSALKDHVSEAETADAALADRLNVIIGAVEPKWVAFLGKFEDVQSKAAAFASLRSINAELERFGGILGSIGDPIAQLNAQIDGLNQKVTDTADALASAISLQDPTQIEQASAAAIQAVIDRYNAEIQLAQQLDEAIHAAQQSAYQLNLTIAQRIASISGDSSQVLSLSQGRIDTLRNQIPGEKPDRGLGDLNDYLGSVDTWLSTNQNDVQTWLQGQLDALQAEEQARVQAAQEAARRAQIARQRELDALQKQLALAQAWVQVLDHAKALIESMQFGESNPLGGFGQLNAINGAISQLTGQGIDKLGSGDADHLLQLLQQRLQVIQSSGLYDRPSGQYLDQYNQTLALIAQVQAAAQPGADAATRLQQQIADLQAQTVNAVTVGTSDITAKEEEVRKEAQERLDAINAQARSYYEWAQTQAQLLEDQRAKDLQDRLDVLTGGIPVDEFIAQKQAEATELLTDIRDNLRTFLNAIEGATNSTNTGGGGSTPGNGVNPPIRPNYGTPGSDGTSSGNVVTMHVTVNANGLDEDAAVRLVNRTMANSASDLKRLLRTA